MKRVMMNNAKKPVLAFLSQFEVMIISELRLPASQNTQESERNTLESHVNAPFELASKVTFVKQETTDDE